MKIISTTPMAHDSTKANRASSKLDTSSPPQLGFPCDVQSLLFVSTIVGREQQESALGARANASATARDRAFAQAQDAREHAKQAEESAQKWGDFVTVAKVVGTVAAAAASIASVVATGGASAPAVIALAGVLLSASSPLVEKAAGKDAGKVAMWGGAALSLGAGAVQVGTAALSTATTTAAAAQSAGQKLAVWVEAGAKVAEGSSRVAQGAGTVGQGRKEGEAADARADGVERRAAAKRAQDQIDEVIDQLREVEASVRRAIHTVIAVGEDIESTRASIIARVGRGAIA